MLLLLVCTNSQFSSLPYQARLSSHLSLTLLNWEEKVELEQMCFLPISAQSGKKQVPTLPPFVLFKTSWLPFGARWDFLSTTWIGCGWQSFVYPRLMLVLNGCISVKSFTSYFGRKHAGMGSFHLSPSTAARPVPQPVMLTCSSRLAGPLAGSVKMGIRSF